MGEMCFHCWKSVKYNKKYCKYGSPAYGETHRIRYNLLYPYTPEEKLLSEAIQIAFTHNIYAFLWEQWENLRGGCREVTWISVVECWWDQVYDITCQDCVKFILLQTWPKYSGKDREKNKETFEIITDGHFPLKNLMLDQNFEGAVKDRLLVCERKQPKYFCKCN